MWNFLVGLLEYTDLQRKTLKLLVTTFLAHLALLIVVQAAIQYANQTLLNPVNAIFGLIWMCGGALVLWLCGGLPLDATLRAYATTSGTENSTTKFAHTVSRILIGFFTVESFVNICFSIFPFYGNFGAFCMLLMAVASYFMFRHMAGEPIVWKKWVWFPMINIGIALLACAWPSLKQAMSFAQNATGQISGLDPGSIFLYSAIALVFIALLSFGTKGGASNGSH